MGRIVKGMNWDALTPEAQQRIMGMGLVTPQDVAASDGASTSFGTPAMPADAPAGMPAPSATGGWDALRGDTPHILGGVEPPVPEPVKDAAYYAARQDGDLSPADVQRRKAGLIPAFGAPVPTEQPPVAPPQAVTPAASEPTGPAGVVQKASMGALLPMGAGGSLSGDERRMNEANERQKSAIQAAAKMEEEKGRAVAAAQQGYIDETQKLEAQRQQLEQNAQAEAQKRLGEVDKLANEIAKPPPSVDPNRFWAQRSTGDKVLAGIGVFLAGLGGNVNAALQPIQQAIQNDIDAQQKNIDNAMRSKQGALAAKQTAFGQFLQMTGDMRAANLAATIAAERRVKSQVELYATKYDAVKPRADALSAQLDESLAVRQAELHQRMQQLALERMKLGVELATKGGDGLTMKDLQAQAQDYGKDIQPLVRAKGALQVLEAAAQKPDVPGTGAYDSRKPGALESVSDTRVRQSKEQVGAVVQQMMSGAGASDAEIQRRLKSFGLDEHASEKEFRAGLPAVKDFFQEQENAINGKYDRRALALHHYRAQQANPASTVRFTPSGG